MLPQLEIDHKHAQILGYGLSKINKLKVETSKIHTNIITGSVEDLSITIDNFLEKLLQKGIKAKKISRTSFRMITHYGVEENDLHEVIRAVEDIIDRL